MSTLGRDAWAHKFNLATGRCVYCNLHEFHLPAVPLCPVVCLLVQQSANRRIVEDGIVIDGPDTIESERRSSPW